MRYAISTGRIVVAVEAPDPATAAVAAATLLDCRQSQLAILGTADAGDDGFWPTAQDEEHARLASLG